MRLVYPPINLILELSETVISTVVVENQNLFYEMIADLNAQQEGLEGIWVLSKDNTPIEISKNIDLITQLIPFIINRKELINKLYSKLKQISYNEEMQMCTNEMLSKIEQYILKLTEECSGELVTGAATDITPLLKMFNVCYNDEYKTLPEKLIEYIFAVNEYHNERLFVIVNLRSYVNDKNAQLLFDTLLNHKIKLVDIECIERTKLVGESRIIIDNDLCVI